MKHTPNEFTFKVTAIIRTSTDKPINCNQSLSIFNTPNSIRYMPILEMEMDLKNTMPSH